MKKLLLKILPLTFCVLSISSASGQSFKGGVQGGLVGSQVAGDLFSGYNKAGLSAGGWVSLRTSVHTEFQMELSYIQKGSRENPNYEKGKFDEFIMRIDYVEMPVLYRMIYSDRLNFETGLSMNFLIHHYERKNGIELNDPFSRSNLCFILGLSYNINDKLRANFRTNNSINSIRTEPRPGSVYRLFGHGQYSDALVLSVYYTL
ncbi:MAG TPA: outer membrane beta-barrel protein [Lentimicrobium sp.]|jgi:hypothetical protein|nr:outer membrane beta-barrel protein [Lentimicrobium sp.]